MEISQLIDAEWSYREGASCRQNATLMLINRAETFSSFSFQLLKVLKALAVGQGRQELLNYLRTGGDLQGELFYEDSEAQEGTNGWSQGKVGKRGGEV